MDDQKLLEILKVALCITAEKYPSGNETILTSKIGESETDPVGDFSVFIQKWDIEKSKLLIYSIGPEEDNFYVQLMIMETYIPLFDAFTESVRIFSLLIPQRLRRQGCATKVIESIEKWAFAKRLPVLIGPVVEEAMLKLLMRKGNYERRSFVDYLYLHPKYRAIKQ